MTETLARPPAPAARALVLPAAFLFMALAASGAAAYTSAWNAGTGFLPDQITCAWTKVNNTANQPSLQSGHLLIATTTTGSNNTYYIQQQSQLLMPPDSLVVECSVRYVSGATGSTARSPVSVVLETSAYRGTAFFVGSGEIFFNSGNVTRGGTAVVPTSDAQHLYRIVVLGTALRIYQDGVLRLTGSTFFDNSSGAFAGFVRILWGEGSSLAYGSSEWVSFTHNAAPGTNCNVTSAPARSWGRLKLLYR